jgi:hypothetical protein
MEKQVQAVTKAHSEDAATSVTASSASDQNAGRDDSSKAKPRPLVRTKHDSGIPLNDPNSVF